MGKLSRTKGTLGERECVNSLKGYLEAKRTAPMQAGWASSFPDVDAPPFAIECKLGKAIGLWAALEQAIKQCPADRVPLVYARKDHGKAVAMMPWSLFLGLLDAGFGVPISISDFDAWQKERNK